MINCVIYRKLAVITNWVLSWWWIDVEFVEETTPHVAWSEFTTDSTLSI